VAAVAPPRGLDHCNLNSGWWLHYKRGGWLPRSLRVERGRDGAGGDPACAIGHVVGHLKDFGKAGARDRAAGFGVLLLLGDGAVQVEADSVVRATAHHDD
jgi:hypothetical protein